MKKITLLFALLSVAGVAAAATASSDLAQAEKVTKAPQADTTTKDTAVLPSGHPDSIPADNNLINKGKVLDVLDSDMYTYVQVTSEQGPLWLAVYKTDIKKGASVKYSGGIAMRNFHSKSLNRTFELIVLVDTLEQAGK